MPSSTPQKHRVFNANIINPILFCIHAGPSILFYFVMTIVFAFVFAVAVIPLHVIGWLKISKLRLLLKVGVKLLGKVDNMCNKSEGPIFLKRAVAVVLNIEGSLNQILELTAQSTQE
ncbi:uncharacterized protein TRUGW13939_00008 [Talaromyces rugulosus]|uniref:Uncharacterized protein n=1 Tax=Talaromyces rugulosus TaxID=121627 RepID=A0A7H8QG73_TALRU|nr:uncharacterized protein TRUGW13939_00008 [Talaromyces rugulosus]QKX52937.1 hypothetical protein TRUGW13939_00008 [Talaromyces rugulosus]